MLASAGLAACGFVLVNPFLIVAPAGFSGNLSAVSGSPFFYVSGVTDLLNHLKQILWDRQYEFDLVFRGGYFQWGFSLAAFAVVVYELIRRNTSRRVSAAFGIATLLTGLMILANGRYLGWYWFPLIVFQVFLLTQIKMSFRTIMAVVLLNAVLNGIVIYHGIELKEELKQNVERRNELQDCAMIYLRYHPAELVVDMSEVMPQIPIFNKSECGPSRSEATVLYILGDRLMRFSAYRERFGDLLALNPKRCSFANFVTVRESCVTLDKRYDDRFKLSYLEK